jgi:hypothetical protein
MVDCAAAVGRCRGFGLAPAQAKLAEVEGKIADLVVIRDTLRDAVAAGCDDLIACAEQPCCPLRSSTCRQEDTVPNAERRRRILPTGLTGLAGAACAACCLIPAAGRSAAPAGPWRA